MKNFQFINPKSWFKLINSIMIMDDQNLELRIITQNILLENLFQIISPKFSKLKKMVKCGLSLEIIAKTLSDIATRTQLKIASSLLWSSLAYQMSLKRWLLRKCEGRQRLTIRKNEPSVVIASQLSQKRSCTKT